MLGVANAADSALFSLALQEGALLLAIFAVFAVGEAAEIAAHLRPLVLVLGAHWAHSLSAGLHRSTDDLLPQEKDWVTPHI